MGKQYQTRDATAVRHGYEQGSVTLGGRRVGVQRPRVRAADGSGELPVAAYELFSSTEILGRLALERMLHGLSTRRYPLGLEPVGTQVEQAASGTSKSAVSRRFVAMTHTALAELLAADLSGLDLVCLMIDGVHFAEHCCVVALGIAIDGTKHPLALVEGSTENAALAHELDKTHPGAAASLREGLAETLTVLRLGVPPTLARTLRSTNTIESMISICRDHAGNVKRWRDGTMAPPWTLRLPRPSAVCARIRRWWKRPDDHRGRHRSSTQLGTSSPQVDLEGGGGPLQGHVIAIKLQ